MTVSIKKATAAQAERLDYIDSEIDRLNGTDSDEAKCDELYQEYYDCLSDYDWDDEVFEENGKKGLKNVKGEITVPAIFDDFCTTEKYYHKSLPVGAVLNGNAALVSRDGKGTALTDFEFDNIECIPFTDVYAVSKKEDKRHFALMAQGKVFTPYEIEIYGDVCDGAVRLASEGKIGMYAYEAGVYIKPEYDDIYDEGVGACFIFVKDGKEGRVTWDKRFVSDEEFETLSDDEQTELEDAGFICAPD